VAVDDPLDAPADAGSLTRAMQRARPEIAELEDRLGHAFADPALAQRALTHVSAPSGGRGESYQRLEFLGDRVLGLVVTEMLYEAFSEASEGDLSVRLARLVRREACAEVGESWDVGPHVILGAGEARAGGRKKTAILGDVCEALIGAVFLDAGFPAARAVVRRHWEARMRADAAPIQDAKTAVQEWAQARGLATPNYREIERSGPAHLPQFVMQVELDGYAPEQGAASSKRAAEQAAAQAFLERWASP
jgi:ribonuclease III